MSEVPKVVSHSEVGHAVPETVVTSLATIRARGYRVVLMTCGISGSGKSTLARSLVERYNFVRFSIDQQIFEQHGMFKKDFPLEKYEQYQDEAEQALKKRLEKTLIAGKDDLVLDFSFYSREFRDEYRAIVAQYGAALYHVVLVYLKADEETLWRRIQDRETQRGDSILGSDRDPAYEVTRSVLQKYVEGFEEPKDEGEIVLAVH